MRPDKYNQHMYHQSIKLYLPLRDKWYDLIITNYIFKVDVWTNKSYWDLKKGFIVISLASIERVVVVVETVLHKFVAFYETGSSLGQALR